MDKNLKQLIKLLYLKEDLLSDLNDDDNDDSDFILDSKHTEYNTSLEQVLAINYCISKPRGWKYKKFNYNSYDEFVIDDHYYPGLWSFSKFAKKYVKDLVYTVKNMGWKEYDIGFKWMGDVRYEGLTQNELEAAICFWHHELDVPQDVQIKNQLEALSDSYRIRKKRIAEIPLKNIREQCEKDDLIYTVILSPDNGIMVMVKRSKPQLHYLKREDGENIYCKDMNFEFTLTFTGANVKYSEAMVYGNKKKSSNIVNSVKLREKKKKDFIKTLSAKGGLRGKFWKDVLTLSPYEYDEDGYPYMITTVQKTSASTSTYKLYTTPHNGYSAAMYYDNPDDTNIKNGAIFDLIQNKDFWGCSCIELLLYSDPDYKYANKQNKDPGYLVYKLSDEGKKWFDTYYGYNKK